MALPNFVIIGAAKAGTTSLDQYLRQHPGVYMSPIKETNFFAFDAERPGLRVWGTQPPGSFPVRDLEAYRALFDGVSDETAVGEASPMYMVSRDAPRRIRQTIPRTKLVAILRNPVDRAYSGYRMAVRHGTERRELADAFGRDEERVRAGFYHAQLQRYYELFERGRIKVLLFEELKKEPLRTVQELFRFLGVDDRFEPGVGVAYNPGGQPRSRLLNALFNSRKLRSIGEPILPPGLRRLVIGMRNRNLREFPPMPPEIRAGLVRTYREDVLRLQELLERDLSRWIAEPRERDTASTAGGT